MQIGSITSTSSFSVAKTTSSATRNSTSAPSDQAVLNVSADSFSNLVKQAGQFPDVRSEVVDAFKSRIHTGHYPSQDIVAGLTRLIGGGVVQQAKSGSSSSSK